MLEENFGECKQCHKNSIIVFDCSWKSQRGSDGKWIKGKSFFLCYPCCRSYGQLPNNYEYDLKVKEMCEVINGK